ncbi:hypothetical protein N8364_00915 [Saprospiraceae bacterium]|nr:hypothetical protein [Saprospiraceae bacterium]MDC1508208.1 hypothetical protein [Saprospiraceae bacterium]
MSVKVNISTFQLKKNFIYNIISLLCTVGLGFYLVPFILSRVGVEAYGYIPIAMLAFDYMSVIIGSVNTSISRFMAFALSKDDKEDARRTYVSSFYLVLILELFFLPFLLYFTFCPEAIIEITTTDLREEVQLLFGFTFLGNLLSFLNGVFGAPLYAFNRIDLGRKRDILRIVVRAAIVIIGLQYSLSLAVIGIANLMSGMATVLFTLYYKQVLTPYMKVGGSFSFKVLRSLLNTIFWLMIGQLGFLLFNKVELLVINRMISPEEAGKFSLILPLVNVVITVGSMITVLFGPTIVYLVANNEYEELKVRLRKVTKFIAICIGVLSTILICFASDILYLWLGDTYDNLPVVLSIIVFSTALVMIARIANTIFQAYDKVKYPGLFTIGLGFINIMSLIGITYYFHTGIVMIAFIGGSFLVLLNNVFFPLIMNRLLRGSGIIVAKESMRFVAIVALPFALSLYLHSLGMALISRIGILGLMTLLIISVQISKQDIMELITIMKSRNNNK